MLSPVPVEAPCEYNKPPSLQVGFTDVVQRASPPVHADGSI
jgi:hypothetical protein